MPSRASLVVVLLVACGGEPEPTQPDAGPPLDAAAGQLWIRAAGITGATGQIVVALVTPSGGGPPIAAACVPVSADPFELLAVAGPTGQGQPCAAGGPVPFTDGTYEVSAGLYTPGQQTPSRCARAQVVIVGAGDVTLPAVAACP